MRAGNKGIISDLLMASVLYIIGYLAGLITGEQPNVLDLGAPISTYGMTISAANVGTMISLDELLK